MEQEGGVNTFVKIFYDCGSGGIERLENAINEFARKRNFDIISANPCFRKGVVDSDRMFIVAVFRKKGGAE